MGHHTAGNRPQRPEEQVWPEGERHSCLDTSAGRHDHHHHHHRHPLLQRVRLPGRDCSLLGTVCRVYRNANTVRQTANQTIEDLQGCGLKQASCCAWYQVKGTRWLVSRPPCSFLHKFWEAARAGWSKRHSTTHLYAKALVYFLVDK